MWVVFCREAEDRFRLKNYKKQEWMQSLSSFFYTFTIKIRP